MYGKFVDQFDRKVVLQASIVIFLAGSILCGVAHNMTELIVLCVLQGLGGGLMVVTMAAIANVIPPANTAAFRACSAASTVWRRSSVRCWAAFLVEHLSWR